MRIRRIRIEEFRKLRRPVCLGGLGDGLTVISGDNEEGKSTVLEAIRAALFCRHRASDDYARALAPFNCDGARPRVELDFAINGHSYRLRKAFCRKPHEAVLATDGKSFQGDAAEEELGRILGLAAARKGATKPEEQGVWGLLWVSQATTFEADSKVGDAARATLSGALEEEVGRVLGGDDVPMLMERIRSRRDELLTDARGNARGDLKLCRERQSAAAKLVADLRVQVEDYRARIADLERLRAQLRQHDQEQTIVRAKEELNAARRGHERAAALVQDIGKAQRELDLADAKFAAAREAWKQRREAIDAAKKAETEEQALAAELEGARRAAQPLQAQLVEAEAMLMAARTRHKAATDDFEAATLALRRARAQHDLAADEEALRKAEAADAAATAAVAAAAAIAVDEQAIKGLRDVAAVLARAKARLEAAETEVRFVPEPGRRIFDGESEIAADQPLRLSGETALRLEGFGTIVIRPGGEDLAARERAVREAEQSLHRRLVALGVVDPAAGEVAYERRRSLLAKAEAERKAVATYAPDGIGVLREAVTAKQAELAALVPDSAEPPLAVDVAQATEETARIEQENAIRDLSTRQEARDARGRALLAAEQASSTLQVRHEEAVKRWNEQRETLAASRAAIADETLLSTLKDEHDNAECARSLLTQAQRDLAGCDPDAAALRLEAAERAVDDIAARLKRLNDEALEREGELRGLGQLGLEEQLATAEGELERAARDLAATERRAAALRLLYDTLREAERDAKRSFAEPVARRMAPYLQTLFPDCELVFAPDLSQIQHLRRNGLQEPFRHLSVGTREQIAVLTRLAFAELLGERGRPAAVILDDALVYSDQTRLARMQQILLRAAERVQVIVLTCRPDDYAGLGVPVMRLADCVADPVG